MAWLFSLSAECGDKSHAEIFGSHFQDMTWQLSDNTTINAAPELMEDDDGNWWCMVVARDLNQNNEMMAEMSQQFYASLRTSPTFRYALVGIEVDLFRTYSELLDDDIIQKNPKRFDGLVLSMEIWKELQQPADFVPFIDGYVWIPYTGSR